MAIDKRLIRKHAKKFLKLQHGITLSNTSKKKYKELVAEGTRLYMEHHREPRS